VLNNKMGHFPESYVQIVDDKGTLTPSSSTGSTSSTTSTGPTVIAKAVVLYDFVGKTGKKVH
jgi:hypothetical protein